MKISRVVVEVNEIKKLSENLDSHAFFNRHSNIYASNTHVLVIDYPRRSNEGAPTVSEIIIFAVFRIPQTGRCSVLLEGHDKTRQFPRLRRSCEKFITIIDSWNLRKPKMDLLNK